MMNYSEGPMKRANFRHLILFFIPILLISCAQGDGGSGPAGGPDSTMNLPDISTFLTTPSDQFLVDVASVTSGHPFKGGKEVPEVVGELFSNSPHDGAHVHFDNSSNQWPVGGSSPENYPPVYAIADGVIDSVADYAAVGSNYKYDINLAFAEKEGHKLLFSYSIEPLINPNNANFYKPYIKVTQGQAVHKGDIIAYFYLPPNGDIGSHIHFHISNTGNNSDPFMAPAIFESSIVSQFHNHFGGFGYDCNTAGCTTNPIGDCMGYKIDAWENPFGTGAKECL